jgi:uncharacterized Zn-binding protein involved in type VI secretion
LLLRSLDVSGFIDEARRRAEQAYHDLGLPAPWEVPPWEIPEQIARRAGVPTWGDALDWLRGRTGPLDLEEHLRRPPTLPPVDDDPPPGEDDGWDWPDWKTLYKWLDRLERIWEWWKSEPSIELVEADWVWEPLDGPLEVEWGEVLDGPAIIESVWSTFVSKVAFAARVGDLMAHGGFAYPGPGSDDVLIGGAHALRIIDQHVCPHQAPVPHAGGAWMSHQASVLVNGVPALRVGDYAIEVPVGPNPITVGCPTVSIGPPAPPVRFGVPVITGHGPPEGARAWLRVDKLELIRLDGDIVVGGGPLGLFWGWEGDVSMLDIEAEWGFDVHASFGPLRFDWETSHEIDGTLLRFEGAKAHLHHPPVGPPIPHVDPGKVGGVVGDIADAKDKLDDIGDVLDVLGEI